MKENRLQINSDSDSDNIEIRDSIFCSSNSSRSLSDYCNYCDKSTNNKMPKMWATYDGSRDEYEKFLNEWKCWGTDKKY